VAVWTEQVRVKQAFLSSVVPVSLNDCFDWELRVSLNYCDLIESTELVHRVQENGS